MKKREPFHGTIRLNKQGDMRKGHCPEKLEDIDYVLRYRNGDEKAFDCLVMRYQDRVYSLCVRMLGDRDEALDCAQEIFMKLYRGMSSFREESSFSTWLFSVSTNACMDFRRARISKKREILYNAEDFNNGGDTGKEQAADCSSDPARLYERKEIQEILINAIRGLGEPEDMLVYLRDIEGLSYEAIEEISGIKMGTVKSKISRAREKLVRSVKGVLQDEL